MNKCDKCGDELVIGSWPFCRGKGSHETVRSKRAQEFEPFVVFRSKKGKIRVPPKGDVPTPKGYERLELRTRREAEGISREMARESERRHELNLLADYVCFEQDMGRNRAEINKLREGADGFTRGYIDHVIREMDQRDANRKRYDPGVYWDVLEKNKGNLD